MTSYFPIGEILPVCRKKLLCSFLLKEILRKNQNKLPKIFPVILYRWQKIITRKKRKKKKKVVPYCAITILPWWFCHKLYFFRNTEISQNKKFNEFFWKIMKNILKSSKSSKYLEDMWWSDPSTVFPMLSIISCALLQNLGMACGSMPSAM